MKNLWLLCLFLLLPSFSFAREGTEGHGGNDTGLEFSLSFTLAVKETKTADPALYADIKKAKLEEVSAVAKVIAVDCEAGKPCPVNYTVTLNGVEQESVAINDPKIKVIFVNGVKWRQISNVHIREGIALHEVASLAGLEDTGMYSLSVRILSRYDLIPEALTDLASPAVLRMKINEADETQRVVNALNQRFCSSPSPCFHSGNPVPAFLFAQFGVGTIMENAYVELGYSTEAQARHWSGYVKIHLGETAECTYPAPADPFSFFDGGSSSPRALLTPACIAKAIVKAKADVRRSNGLHK